MRKITLFLFVFVVLLLAAQAADAQLIRPEVVLKEPPSVGDTIKEDVNFILDVRYPEGAVGDKVLVNTVIFEYRNHFCAGSGKCVRGTVGTDKDGTDGWSALWDTTQVPDDDYYITAYVFGGDGSLLVSWYKSGYFHINQTSGKSVSPFQAPAPIVTNVTVNQTNATGSQNTTNQTTQTTTPVQQVVNVSLAKVETGTKASEQQKKGFWGSFFQWIKDIFS